MHLKLHLIFATLLVVFFIAMAVFSFKRCGWGMFAYENAFIAAITKECAQQQRELLRSPEGIAQ